EQEGQQTETEATGAPQKHHYTLNQQVGSITSLLEFNIQKANAFLIESCNCFLEGKDNGFRPLAFSNSRDELLEIKKYLNRARG
ncbi:hypothetical protein M2D69_28440, partial [Klebsiella pneumoniae]|nr:hypothetical protein [Klebsiella pneumoniae]MDZ3348632.1 hypothetical protein [Klebsiella pneumoniae]MDZ3354160.1 hypothetical protein [Klebsiella pneumoniae]MDZ3479573.1 hypothetical protein [Klebsiella pneumoniae]